MLDNRFRRKDKHFLSYILRFPVKDEKTDEKTSQMFDCLGKYAYLRSVKRSICMQRTPVGWTSFSLNFDNKQAKFSPI